MNTVVDRYRSGQHGCVRRQCHGAGRNDIFKEKPFCGEGIYIRRGVLFVAITAEMIGPAGIDTDKENIADLSNIGSREIPLAQDNNGQ